jgi:hypothetical protein
VPPLYFDHALSPAALQIFSKEERAKRKALLKVRRGGAAGPHGLQCRQVFKHCRDAAKTAASYLLFNMQEEMQRGYFDDFQAFRDSKGKVFQAPERLAPASHVRVVVVLALPACMLLPTFACCWVGSAYVASF